MTDRDVVVVGGGPAGCSAGIFTARYGLDTVVFDRGRSSLLRCAHLENYLGFPGGIDIETFYDLMHDHAMVAGCAIVTDMVDSVDHGTEESEFVVETQDGRVTTTRCVVAATRYDGDYLRPLDDGGMFETHEYDGEEHERFDRSYAITDGTTPTNGLYVASPSTAADRQAIVAAGRGARIGLTVVEHFREQQGYPASVADHYDWVRREGELDEEWSDRDRWEEWFGEQLPEEHGLDQDDRIALRDREIDRILETYLTKQEIEQRADRGHERLLDHLDDDLIIERARELTDNQISTEARE